MKIIHYDQINKISTKHINLMFKNILKKHYKFNSCMSSEIRVITVQNWLKD